MRRLHTRLVRLREDESGLSMTELLVSAILTSIMLAMIGTMFVQTTRLTTAASQTHNSNAVAASMSNGVTAVLRTATTLAKSGSEIPDPAIVSGSREALSIYAFSNTSFSSPAPTKITYSITDSDLDGFLELTETRCTGVASGGFWTFGGCAATTKRSFGEGLQNSVSDTLFSYHDAGGAPIVIGTTALTAEQRKVVGSIIVTVRVKAPGSTNDPVVITSKVVLRNLGLDTGEED
jgi:type II secretory pathway pseudopilin PulG